MQNAFNWRDAKLGDICTLRAESIDPARATGLPYVGLEHLDSGQPTLTRHGSPTEVRSLKNRFYRGDILYGKLRPYLDKAVCADREGICSTDILVFKPDTVALSSFLIHLVHNRAFVEHAVKTTKGVNHPRTSWHSLSEFEFRLPSTEEQDAIARTLDAVQRAKETRLRESALERERKAALMEHLFTHGTRGEPTKQTEVGAIPESWELTVLGELCENELGVIQTGPFGSQLHASDYIQSGVPVVNPTHLLINGIETDRLPGIAKELADSLSRHYLQEGDILISRRGDFSRFAYIRTDQAGWLCGTGCLLVRLANPRVNNFFLASLMSREPTQNYLRQAAVGSIMPNLNTRILSRMPVVLPGIEEQRRIGEVVRSCEAKIIVLECEASFFDELFRAILEEMMSGRLSAVPLIEEHQPQ